MIANLKRIQKRGGANAIGRFCARWALAAAVTAGSAFAEAPVAPLALRDGETLTYSVRWGFIPSVGRIKITARASGTGGDRILTVTTTTSTWGLARGLFPFDGRGESVYNIASGLLLSSTESSSYRNKQVKNSITFDYGKGTAAFVDEVHPEKSRPLTMPQGNPSDLILALIQTRYWNLAPGQSRDSLVIFEDQFYPLTIRNEDTDFIYSELGFFKTVVLVPRMEKTPPIGMFKRGSTVRVWIETQDARHLPVRFEVGFKFGSGTATLTDYQPPK
jgi:hypothetical protein